MGTIITYKVRLHRDAEWETIPNVTSYTVTQNGDLTIYNGSVAVESFGRGYWIMIKEA